MFSMTNLYFCEACFTGQYSILLFSLDHLEAFRERPHNRVGDQFLLYHLRLRLQNNRYGFPL